MIVGKKFNANMLNDKQILKNTSNYTGKISSWSASHKQSNNNNNNNNNSFKNNIHSPEVHDSKLNIKNNSTTDIVKHTTKERKICF
jgi:hypothetical protein